MLSGRGDVKVKPTLQVEGYPRIFAVGDIIDWDEQKQAVKARQGHTPVVVANILSLVNGLGTRKVYKGFFELLALVVGRVSSAFLLLVCLRDFTHPGARTGRRITLL